MLLIFEQLTSSCNPVLLLFLAFTTMCFFCPPIQAPVSDREYRATLPDTASMIDLASKMISEGKGSELMPREANPDAPITADRSGHTFNCCFPNLTLAAGL